MVGCSLHPRRNGAHHCRATVVANMDGEAPKSCIECGLTIQWHESRRTQLPYCEHCRICQICRIPLCFLPVVASSQWEKYEVVLFEATIVTNWGLVTNSCIHFPAFKDISDPSDEWGERFAGSLATAFEICNFSISRLRLPTYATPSFHPRDCTGKGEAAKPYFLPVNNPHIPSELNH